VALILFLTAGKNSQEQAINKGTYQAVFLNNGQVYFGKIAHINPKSIDLGNIYYLQTSSTGQSTTQQQSSSSVSLVKLGCELHAPYDRMIINADQVIFWENIQNSSQVVKAIDAYNKQNGGKLNCDSTSQNSTQQAPSTSTSTGASSATPAAGTTTPTTSTSTGTTKKP
jgi:hypothetical protein